MALDFFAGCVGGCAGVLVGHPLDTVKVHLQTQDPKNPVYRGTWHCMRTLVAQERLRGLYRGISSPIGGIGFVNAIVFGIYGNVQRHTDDPNSLWSHALAGSVAGLFQSIVCSPMELAKTRMQLQHNSDKGPKFKGPLDCLRQIFHSAGWRGVYKGLLFTAARDVPGFASYFLSYEYMMRLTSAPNALYSLVAGGLAGICSWLACYPVDVVKTCIQAEANSSHPKYRGYMDCIQKGYRSDGVHFFFRGINSTMIRSFPMNAACFFVVSWIMRLAKTTNVDVVVQTRDPIAMVGLASPHYHALHYDRLEAEVERRRFHMAQGLKVFGAFNEAVSHAEAEELATEFYPDNNKYYIFEDERLLHGEPFEPPLKQQSVEC